MIYLIKEENLPWFEVVTSDLDQSFNAMALFKRETKPVDICTGSAEPLLPLLEYCYNLK